VPTKPVAPTTATFIFVLFLFVNKIIKGFYLIPLGDEGIKKASPFWEGS
jgi:hypothetical protein